jgi:hypothetical protein
MTRRQPYWYSRWHGSIMLLFDTAYRQPDISSVYVLPSFPNPVFELDGVHMTADIGPRYNITTMTLMHDSHVISLVSCSFIMYVHTC